MDAPNLRWPGMETFIWAMAEIKINFRKEFLNSEIPSKWLQKSHCYSQQWQNHTQKSKKQSPFLVPYEP